MSMPSDNVGTTNWRWVAAMLLVAAALFGENALAAPADGCGMFKRIAGAWAGTGKLRRAQDAEAAPLRCHLTIAWWPATRTMTSTLDCRGIDLDFKLWSSISEAAPDGRLAGAMTGSQGFGGAQAEGRCERGRVTLHLRSRAGTTGDVATGDLTIALSADGRRLTNTVVATGAATRPALPALSIRFER
jgi:hypothetical protein